MNKKISGTISIFLIGILIAGLYKLLSNEGTSTHDIESLSDDDLKTMREKVRQCYCTANNFSLAVKLENLLHMFDAETRKRTANENNNYEFPKHGEHGWHLPSDDN